MRLLNLYVVIDEKAKVLVGPIVHDHSPVPITRQIVDAVNNPQTMIAKNPEDFSIWYLGTVDEETGLITALDTPQRITTALALRAVQQ